jgi:Holliday junction resolvase RusA-like endonuclease
MTRSGHTWDPGKAIKRVFLEKIRNLAPKSPYSGPISMSIEFYVPRPKAHYRTGQYSHLLKDTAPKYPIVRGGKNHLGDLDNYLKLAMDALDKVFYKDDVQVCVVHTLKEYSSNPRTVVQIKGVE